MTAFGLKQAGGTDGMGKDHPFGKIRAFPFIFRPLRRDLAGRIGEPRDMAGTGERRLILAM